MSKNLPLSNLTECSIDEAHIIDSKYLDRNSYIFKVKKYYTSSVENQPNNLSHPNTLVYCNTGSDKVLIVVGESWTYGDSLTPFIKASEGKDNLPYRLGNTFSAHLANYLGSDLLLYAEPGNANFDIWSNIQPLINYSSNYKDIYIVSQLTTPGRDVWIDDREMFQKHRLKTLFTKSDTRLPLRNWLIKYDNYYLDWGRELLYSNNIKKLVIWKNFNRFYSDNFKDLDIINHSFMEYCIQFSGRSADISFNQHLDFYNLIESNSNIELNLNILNTELDKVDRDYNELAHSMLNNFHPNLTGHWVLASLIRTKLETMNIYNK